MSDQFWLTKAQLKRIEPFFPRTRGIPRVDDRRVVSGIVHVIRNGLRWRDASAVYGPHKTLYIRFVRWSRMGIFDRIFANLAAESGPPDRVMIDSTHLKAHRTAASLLKRGDSPRLIGRTKGGLNSKLHAVCDGGGRPVTSARCRLVDQRAYAVLPHIARGRWSSRHENYFILNSDRAVPYRVAQLNLLVMSDPIKRQPTDQPPTFRPREKNKRPYQMSIAGTFSITTGN
jgi:transposase